MSVVADRMRRRRQEMGLSLQEAQSALRIHRRHLHALEAGHLRALPGGEAHAAAMLRAYANFLGLDGAALLADLRHEAAGTAAEAGAVKRSGADALGEALRRVVTSVAAAAGRRTSRGVAIAAAVLALLAVAGGALALRSRSAERPAGAAALHAPGTAEEVVATTGGGAGGAGSGSAGRTDSRPARPAPAVAGSAAGSPPAAPPAAPHSAAAATAASGAARRPAGSGVSVSRATSAAGIVTYTVHGAPSLTVAVRAAAPCWYRVWVDGASQHTDGMLVAGGSAGWTAGRQLQVRLGFPEGVHLSVDGVALPFIPRPDPVDLVFVRAAAP
jgi:cytoskeleton protein RodZ